MTLVLGFLKIYIYIYKKIYIYIYVCVYIFCFLKLFFMFDYTQFFRHILEW